MLRSKLEEAIEEAERFISKGMDLLKVSDPRPGYIEAPTVEGQEKVVKQRRLSVRRASMDLSRSLIELRKEYE